MAPKIKNQIGTQQGVPKSEAAADSSPSYLPGGSRSFTQVQSNLGWEVSDGLTSDCCREIEVFVLSHIPCAVLINVDPWTSGLDHALGLAGPASS